ncbi:MAG TPA: GxxExxY protein [bacterium]|nr:GxxExxY protein [bacterium]
MTENEIGTLVIEKAIAIHRDLGPGLLESVYEAVLCHELVRAGVKALRQVPIPFSYHDVKFDESFRADIIVEQKVILEIKSIENVNNVHKKQVLTYLRLSGLKLGYLLNFGEELMKDGIYRIINGKLE